MIYEGSDDSWKKKAWLQFHKTGLTTDVQEMHFRDHFHQEDVCSFQAVIDLALSIHAYPPFEHKHPQHI